MYGSWGLVWTRAEQNGVVGEKEGRGGKRKRGGFGGLSRAYGHVLSWQPLIVAIVSGLSQLFFVFTRIGIVLPVED